MIKKRVKQEETGWKAVARIKDFLLQKVNSLKKPKPPGCIMMSLQTVHG